MKNIIYLLIGSYLLAAGSLYGGYYASEESFEEDFRVHMSYRTKRGLGFPSGYASFGGLYTPRCDYDGYYPIFDIRLHRIDNGHFASNLGFGVRKQFCDVILGANLFYDFRDTWLATYHQIGVGCELFTNCADFRFNGYFPVGPVRRHDTRTFNFAGGFTATRHLREFSSHLVEFEVGRGFCFFSKYNLYAAGGVYYLKSRARGNAYGGKWRVATTLRRCLTLEVAGTYDHIFQNRVQFYVGVDLPIRKLSWSLIKGCCQDLCSDTTPCCTLDPRLARPIYRNELIILRRSCFWATNYL